MEEDSYAEEGSLVSLSGATSSILQGRVKPLKEEEKKLLQETSSSELLKLLPKAIKAKEALLESGNLTLMDKASSEIISLFHGRGSPSLDPSIAAGAGGAVLGALAAIEKMFGMKVSPEVTLKHVSEASPPPLPSIEEEEEEKEARPPKKSPPLVAPGLFKASSRLKKEQL